MATAVFASTWRNVRNPLGGSALPGAGECGSIVASVIARSFRQVRFPVNRLSTYDRTRPPNSSAPGPPGRPRAEFIGPRPVRAPGPTRLASGPAARP
ncbi:hypothetical protein GCM10009830_29210 [Glycomyces endophyticus]|uniref:Uncharacterized protein n=1 Tax=Glycomyces endophyticus TaxID=480996 RepID=A0ABN2H2W1_9ACTN